MFDAAQRDFVSLISYIPELVEPYEGTNADGATVRRFAIVNADQEVGMLRDTGQPSP